MTKTQSTIEHVVVTFVESALAYVVVIPTVNWNRTVIAGAIGAGLSAAYNILRQSNPPVVTATPAVAPPVVMPPETIPPATPEVAPEVSPSETPAASSETPTV